MRRFSKRYRLVVLVGRASVLALVFVGRSLNATKRGGQGPAEPFRLAGNFYYVGATDVAAFLITGPEGHIVLDGGYPSTAPMIMASIAKLGFNIRDVKVLLNSEPHPDHAGGLGVLQQESGAELWASEASAFALESGGDDPDGILPMRLWCGLGSWGTRRCESTIASRMETSSASDRSRSPRISPAATRADAPHGRSTFVTVTAC